MKPGSSPRAAQTETKEKIDRASSLRNQFSAARASIMSNRFLKQTKAFSSTAQSNAVSGHDLGPPSTPKKSSGPPSDGRIRNNSGRPDRKSTRLNSSHV